MHMLLSDLVPLTLFTIYAITNHYPDTIIGPIISRLFSLVYHSFEARHPSLLYLDYLGICTMAFSVPAACSIAAEGWGNAWNMCEQFNIAVAISFLSVSAELAVNCYSSKSLLFRSPEHAIIALALLGNLPIIAIIAHQPLASSSPSASRPSPSATSASSPTTTSSGTGQRQRDRRPVCWR
jgi:hypothetical protein